MRKLNFYPLMESVLKKTGLFQIFSFWYAGCGSILMFHRICKQEEKSLCKSNYGLEITPENLEKIILYFDRKGYDFVAIGDVPRILNSAGKQRKKFVVFTFDDGFADNFILAYPILRKYKIPFTIYITTSFPDKNAVLWWYMLDELVLNNRTLEFDAHGTHYSFNCCDGPNKEASWMSISNIIRGSTASDFPRVIEGIFPKYGIDWRATTARLAIGWDMIVEMSKDDLVTIGAHTVNHLALKKLSQQELDDELRLSKSIIESKINRPVKAFSYPFGGINEAGLREFEAVTRAGFETGTTTRESNIFKQHKFHLASLPRIIVNGHVEKFLNIEWDSGFVPFYRAKGKSFVLE